MSYDYNPISNPQDFGFTEVVTVGDLKVPCYDFYEFAVLRKEDGYYLSTDSGCSCPSPWESHTAEDFTGPLTASQVHEEVHSLAETSYDRVPDSEIDEALAPVV